MDAERSYTVSALALRWRKRKAVVRDLIRRGLLPAFTLGKSLRISPEAVRKFEEQNAVAPRTMKRKAKRPSVPISSNTFEGQPMPLIPPLLKKPVRPHVKVPSSLKYWRIPRDRLLPERLEKRGETTDKDGNISPIYVTVSPTPDDPFTFNDAVEHELTRGLPPREYAFHDEPNFTKEEKIKARVRFPDDHDGNVAYANWVKLTRRVFVSTCGRCGRWPGNYDPKTFSKWPPPPEPVQVKGVTRV